MGGEGSILNIFAKHFSILSMQDAGAGGFIGMLIPMAIMIAVFYFLLIRPQSKQRKLLQQKINDLKKGDKFVTTGGIYCTVVGIKDNIVVGKISDNVKIEINKAYVANVVDKNETITVSNKNNKKLEVVDTEENTDNDIEENTTEDNKE